MPSIGPLEIMVIAVVALIVFGPQRLPEMARSVGRALADFRRAAGDMKRDFDLALDEEDDDEGDTAAAEPVTRPVQDEAGRFPVTVTAQPASEPAAMTTTTSADKAAPARKAPAKKKTAVASTKTTGGKTAKTRATKTTKQSAAKKTTRGAKNTTRSASPSKRRKT